MKNTFFICLVVSVVGAVLVNLSGLAYAEAPQRGQQHYRLCASCHGFKGEGSVQANSPTLAGQEAWYLRRQIQNFRRGLRGNSSTDLHGQRMAQMMGAIQSDQAVDDIVAYIISLPKQRAVATLNGDLAQGKKLYANCIACHGDKAQGNPTLNAPALASLDDWYQLEQLIKFKDGRRGAHPDDAYGQQMAPMAKLLKDEQAMRDIVAFINSLQ